MTEPTVLPVAEPSAELLPTPPGRAPLLVRLVTLGLIAVPLLGLVAAPFFLWGWGFSWTDMGLLIGMYLLTAVGITVGFHRLFVHRSFETYTWFKFVFACSGRWPCRGRCSSGWRSTAGTTSTATSPTTRTPHTTPGAASLA